jgi:hypothetical protein
MKPHLHYKNQPLNDVFFFQNQTKLMNTPYVQIYKLGLMNLKAGGRYCGMSAEIRSSSSEETSVAGQWLGKRHVTADRLTYTTIEELLEAAFSMPSAATATSRCNKATARKRIFCRFRPEAI